MPVGFQFGGAGSGRMGFRSSICEPRRGDRVVGSSRVRGCLLL